MKMKSYDVVCLESIPQETVCLLLSLQGIVNRTKPLIYLLPQREAVENHWMEWYKRYGLEGREVSWEDMVARHGKTAAGYVVFDPDLPDSLNVAMSLAGVKNALVCPPSLADLLDQSGLERIADFKVKWPHKIFAYRWAVDHVMPLCDLSLLANYDQGEQAHPSPTMDLLVARRGFCLGLSVNDADYPAEAELWDKVQSSAPDHAMMIGWHTPRDSEATHVSFAGRHNVWVYCATSWNMSFHQHIKARKAFSQNHAARRRCDSRASYVTLALSDGDSWHSMCDGQKKFWFHPRRGEVPLGWEVAPIFARIAPGVLEYYYETKTENDYLICGPSGIAYNYLSGFGDWKGFLRHTAQAMKETSLKTIWTINRAVRHLPGGIIEHRLKDGPVCYNRQQMEEFGGIKDEKGADWVDPLVVERYAQAIPAASGFFQGWERIPGEQPRFIKGKLWCPTVALVRDNVDAAIRECERAREAQSLPAFIAGHVNCYKANMDLIIEVVKRLEEKGFQVVRPDVFLELARNAGKR